MKHVRHLMPTRPIECPTGTTCQRTCTSTRKCSLRKPARLYPRRNIDLRIISGVFMAALPKYAGIKCAPIRMPMYSMHKRAVLREKYYTLHVYKPNVCSRCVAFSLFFYVMFAQRYMMVIRTQILTHCPMATSCAHVRCRRQHTPNEHGTSYSTTNLSRRRKKPERKIRMK